MEAHQDEELEEYHFDPQDRVSVDSVQQESEDIVKRGAKRIEEAWTRVISIRCDNLQRLRHYPLATDLLVTDGYDKASKRGKAK